LTTRNTHKHDEMGWNGDGYRNAFHFLSVIRFLGDDWVVEASNHSSACVRTVSTPTISIVMLMFMFFFLNLSVLSWLR
jgi:hypothetical protein